MTEYGVVVGSKPLLWFVKDHRNDPTVFVEDTIEGAGREKDSHPWQQAENEAAYYIDKLTTCNGIVLDPMCGSGTTLVAAKGLGRQWIGYDIDASAVEKARKRLNA